MNVPPYFIKTWLKIAKEVNKGKLDDLKKYDLIEKLEKKYNVNYTCQDRCFVGEAYNFENMHWFIHCKTCDKLGHSVFDKLFNLKDFTSYRIKLYKHFLSKHKEYLKK